MRTASRAAPPHLAWTPATAPAAYVYQIAPPGISFAAEETFQPFTCSQPGTPSASCDLPSARGSSPTPWLGTELSYPEYLAYTHPSANPSSWTDYFQTTYPPPDLNPISVYPQHSGQPPPGSSNCAPYTPSEQFARLHVSLQATVMSPPATPSSKPWCEDGSQRALQVPPATGVAHFNVAGLDTPPHDHEVEAEAPPRHLKALPRKYQCHECFKSFARPSGLVVHSVRFPMSTRVGMTAKRQVCTPQVTHSRVKLFECIHYQCGKTFSVQSNREYPAGGGRSVALTLYP